jgi:formylmethanofuran dehydrogenase subunit E
LQIVAFAHLCTTLLRNILLNMKESIFVEIDKQNPRREIEEAIANNNLEKLLLMTGMLHGHYCPFSSLGVKAATRAVRELGAKSSGMEETIAIVEANNCFSDGIQFVTGCSFGNNALIYRDFGKTAFTLAKRSGDAIRIAVKIDTTFLEKLNPGTTELFNKVITQRKGTPEEQKRLKELWQELSFKLLSVPDDDVFDIKKIQIAVPAYARIFVSAKCSVCGENVMEPRARLKDAKPVCLPCSTQDYYQLAGDGISLINP